MKNFKLQKSLGLGVIALATLGFNTIANAQMSNDSTNIVYFDSTNYIKNIDTNYYQNDTTVYTFNDTTNTYQLDSLTKAKLVDLINTANSNLTILQNQAEILKANSTYIIDSLTNKHIAGTIDTLAATNSAIFYLNDKVTYLKNCYYGFIPLDSSELNIDLIDEIKIDTLSKLEDKRIDLLKQIDYIKNSQNTSNDSSWYSALYETYLMNEDLIKSLITGSQSGLVFMTNDVTDLNKTKDSLYYVYNNLIYNNVENIDSLDYIKKQILFFENKLQNLDTNYVYTNYIDSSYWNNNSQIDSVYNGEIYFNWNTKYIEDKYIFQLSTDSTFSNIIYEVDSLAYSYVKISQNSLIELLADSSQKNANQRVASTTTGNTIYWRTGVSGNNGVVWSAPVASSVSKLTAIGNDKTVQLGAYPNPTTDALHINANAEIESVNIFTITGLNVKSFTNQNTYDVSDLNAGIYILVVKTSNGVAQTKIVKN